MTRRDAQLLGAAYIDDWRLMNVNKEAIDQAAEALIAQGELMGDEISGLLDSVGMREAKAADPYPPGPADGPGPASADRGRIGVGLIRGAPANPRRSLWLRGDLIRLAATALAAVVLALPAQAVHAQDPDAGPTPHHEAARLIAAELAMTQASGDLTTIAAQQPSGLMETLRKEFATDRATYAFRVAARQEELRVYELAGYASVESAVVPLLPPAVQNPVENTIAGLHSLYILSGIDQYYLVNVHFTHPYSDARSVTLLRSYYAEASNLYGVDASYLASINFIESNFGRINGPSSAGAQGPMQFLPSTWTEYGQGGNINDPHDAILAAARYLAHNGAPYDMRNAIWHYNNDFDYVDAVESFARAYRTDPGWLDRMYYWNTFG